MKHIEFLVQNPQPLPLVIQIWILDQVPGQLIEMPGNVPPGLRAVCNYLSMKQPGTERHGGWSIATKLNQFRARLTDAKLINKTANELANFARRGLLRDSRVGAIKGGATTRLGTDSTYGDQSHGKLDIVD